MPTKKWSVRVVATTLAAGALLGATAAPASAWPITLTQEDTNYLDQGRGVFPGDDDQLLLVGRQICRGLMTGQGTQAMVDSMAAQYGASPDQAATAVRAAHGTYCTSASG